LKPLVSSSLPSALPTNPLMPDIKTLVITKTLLH
jgi:hypothetical protein